MHVQILHSVGFVTLPLGPALPSHQELERPTPKHEHTKWREKVLIGTQPMSLLSFPLVWLCPIIQRWTLKVHSLHALVKKYVCLLRWLTKLDLLALKFSLGVFPLNLNWLWLSYPRQWFHLRLFGFKWAFRAWIQRQTESRCVCECVCVHTRLSADKWRCLTFTSEPACEKGWLIMF